jgi:two-component system NarL family sensor kinase
VSWSAAATRERHDLPVELQVTGNVVRLPQDIEITVYQAVKELINNVVKHASSPRLDIEIAFSGGWLRVTVADQGRGFNLEETRPHLSGGFGLRNIRERLAYIGGELTVETSAGNGTRCTITIPTEASPDTLQESMK